MYISVCQKSNNKTVNLTLGYLNMEVSDHLNNLSPSMLNNNTCGA